MIYNNLLFFLAAIFLFSMATVPVETTLSGWVAGSVFVVLGALFDRFVRNAFSDHSRGEVSAYFSAERRASVAALVFFSILVFGLDLKYYLNFLSIGERLPSLVNIAGLIVFFALFVIVWGRARKSYEAAFSRRYSAGAFLFSNIKANLPIVIPWVILTLCYDLLSLLRWPWLQDLTDSLWGDVIFFTVFLLVVFVLFPPLVRRLWGCRELGAGPLRDHLLSFCRKQNFSAKLYLWPLFEGRVITAGVMGIFPGLRYILLTPALIETMTLPELDAVMAHEIGHVKRFHLPLYVFLLGGFMIGMGYLAEPLFFFMLTRESFYSFLDFSGFPPDTVRNVVIILPALAMLLLYFRFIFGYFMRNFERQADLHVFSVLGNSRGIISAFEKIAIVSGNTRDEPSWHHFGIGQRVDYLLRCERNPDWIGRHHRKVALSIGIYVVLFAAALFSVGQLSFEESKAVFERKYTRADLLYNAGQEELPARWLLFAGNFYVEHKLEERATTAYELALEMEPAQPEILNNYAWLLLTSRDRTLRDPERALDLARAAAALDHQGYILDTLATAWWANGFVDEAIATAGKALAVDPEQTMYYLLQQQRFQVKSYAEELEELN